MYRNAAVCFLLLSMALPACAAEPKVTFLNYLKRCVATSNGTVVKQDNALLYQVRLELFAGDIADCGCRSMVGSYRVHKGKLFVRSEELVLRESRQVSLFVEADDHGPQSEDLTITLGCGGTGTE